jgi:hypothetical protein
MISGSAPSSIASVIIVLLVLYGDRSRQPSIGRSTSRHFFPA